MENKSCAILQDPQTHLGQFHLVTDFSGFDVQHCWISMSPKTPNKQTHYFQNKQYSLINQ